jgi:hypothetical protein
VPSFFSRAPVVAKGEFWSRCFRGGVGLGLG